MRDATLVIAAAALLLAPGPLSAATHIVMQSGLTFQPADLTIEVGDTVEWQWTAGLHTVTEGTDDANPPPGDKLFDEPLTSGNPNPSFTFTQAGDVDYYCRPHLALGMVGVIRVQEATPSPEIGSETWSRLKNLYR